MNVLYRKRERGASFLDVIVGVALIALIFWGIVGAFLLAINLVTSAKAKSGALSLAVEQLEFIRSLSYDDVGTVSGIPSGAIPQLENIMLNDVNYTRRTFIQFVDAPQDGEGEDDENGITADYKEVKVELTWDIHDDTRSLSLVSTIVPKGIETTAGGGTLIVNVINAVGLPVEGASVQVVNDSTDPVIDVTTFSNANGKITFPGSPEANSYAITVTKDGYSSAQTYAVDATNVAPSPGHLSILEGQVSEITFAIDLLAEKTIEVYEWLTTNSHDDSFADETYLETLSFTEVSSGDVVLSVDEVSMEHHSAGEVVSTSIEPAFLGGWLELSFVQTKPANTDIVYKVLYEEAPTIWSEVPDSDLSGNSVGFTNSPINLASLDTTTYPALKIQASLSTSDTLVTPRIHEWSLSYQETTPFPNAELAMRGTKTIGKDTANEDIYKYDENLTTDGNGVLTVSDLEWDTYTISVRGNTSNYDIRESCFFSQPRAINPGVATTTTLYLVPQTDHALHVVVSDSNGSIVPGTSVNLKRTGYDETETSSVCGQVFFSDLTDATNYMLTVSAAGYRNNVTGGLEISGYTDIEVTLTPQ